MEVQPISRLASLTMSPELAQLADVAELLGVEKRTAAKYVNLGNFPPPVEQLSGGRVWARVEVVAWGNANLPLRRTGRPPKAS